MVQPAHRPVTSSGGSPGDDHQEGAHRGSDPEAAPAFDLLDCLLAGELFAAARNILALSADMSWGRS